MLVCLKIHFYLVYNPVGINLQVIFPDKRYILQMSRMTVDFRKSSKHKKCRKNSKQKNF